MLLSIVAIAGIFLLLFIALKSVRSAFLVMANLPLALIDGVVRFFCLEERPEDARELRCDP